MRLIVKAINGGTRRLDRWTYGHPLRTFLVAFAIFVLVCVGFWFEGATFDRVLSAPIMGVQL